MYTVLFSDTAWRQLEKLDQEIRRRILAALRRCRIRPQDFVKRLIGVPYYCLRVGDYRVIVGIREGNLRIMVIDVGHRRNIYKR